MKYQVIVTRDITESTFIDVEADNPQAAEEAAVQQLAATADPVWEVDDCPAKSSPYITGVEEQQ